jgi:hypothetical protein
VSANGQPPVAQGPPVLPGGQVQMDPAIVTNALLIAVKKAADAGAGAQDNRDIQAAAAAALSFAQAIVVLDPSLSQGGTPLAHDLALEQMRGETQVAVEKQRGDNAVRQAKETAAAPTPAKEKSVSVQRDANGRPSKYSVTGG